MTEFLIAIGLAVGLGAAWFYALKDMDDYLNGNAA